MSHSKATSRESTGGCLHGSPQNSPYSVDRFVTESSSWTTYTQRSRSSQTSCDDPMQSELDGLLRQAQETSPMGRR
ncbi:hypothetical protein CMUS01_07510 [Colletotrichum musicola]|uniref:Uncharacterized protein n=1 Tax=Colletotrichum musicola TaxID=2175873 RepID=A0A8H6NFW2_9PEZI|nr:hypothetical protein CMUS01_07510 [Colletotrichum musicola]